MNDLFDSARRPSPAAPDAEPGRAPERERILVFDIAVQGTRETAWQELFQGFRDLKAITFSASVPAILDVAALFDDVEITFGSERVLSRELEALEQVTTATAYRFTDALADQKVFIERFVRPALSRRGAQLLERVQDGSLRFRLLREAPSHAKLYLLAGNDQYRTIAGSANLSLAAFSGRQRETFFVADSEADYQRFLDYYAENQARSDPIDADLLVVTADDGAADLNVPADPVPLQHVPCFRFLKAQGVIIETPRPVIPDLSAAALREAGALGAELQQIALDRDRNGRSVISASSFMRAYRAHAARPITEKTDRVPEARIELASGLVTLEGRPWHRIGAPVPWPEVQADAALLAPYFGGFGRFYGDAPGLQRSYWALLCWLYAAPFAPALRTAALRHDGSPLAYPVHAVLYGRSDGGKTMFSRVISRSMFGLEQMVRGKDFTTQRALGLRERLGAIPLVVDDVNRDRFTQYVPDLVKFDHESGEGYAPILISTNRDVTAVTPDLRKRMVVCHIDGARPRGMPEAPARAALSGVGTAIYRAYLDRLVPRLAELTEALARDPHHPPDLLLVSSETLSGLLAEALGSAPDWIRPIAQEEIEHLKDKPLLDLLDEILDQNSERVRINRSSGDLVVNFGGDHNQAARFEKLVPAQALKGRFADAVKLDLDALERDFGFAPARRAGRTLGVLLARLLGR
jgi:NgoFVII restriction endonuclease N-terminal PLD domain